MMDPNGSDSDWATLAMERENREVLAHLPPETRRYVYSGMERMEDILCEESSHYQGRDFFVVFTQIPPAERERIVEHIGGKQDLLLAINTLIIEMPSRPHEVANRGFDFLMGSKARGMGVKRQLAFEGHADENIRARKKQADSCYCPSERPRRGEGSRPTVVLEVGCRVNRVVTIDIKRVTGNIVFTAWEQGARPTVQYPNPEPVAVQQIKINRSREGDQPSVVGDQSITAPFEQLLLYEPGVGEGDFVFSRQELLELAEDTWIVIPQ